MRDFWCTALRRCHPEVMPKPTKGSIMYLTTDSNAIARAVDAAAPRPIADVILEYYPDCTIDANGRGHAPYDGYICPFTDKAFRAGEYLPFDDCDEIAAFKRMTRPSNVRVIELYNVKDSSVTVLEGTRAQINAARDVAKEQTAEWDRTREHVGTLKSREILDLTLLSVFANDSAFGTTWTHYFRDSAGNSVVWKGSKRLAIGSGYREKTVPVGESVRIKATVKSHWTAPDGRKATYIQRPVILD